MGGLLLLSDVSLCRSRHDRLAYAVHAFLLADGYKLVGTGKDAEKAPKGRPPECMSLPFLHQLTTLLRGALARRPTGCLLMQAYP